MATRTEQGFPAPKMSLLNYLVSEVTRGYVLENDEERYTTRREKMYTFMKIPREVEKFMSYGFFHCLDSFLFVFTFLPIRFLTAFLKLVFKTPLYILRLYRPSHGRLLFPAEIIDLLKGFIIGLSVYVMSYIDTSMMYHLIKSQSVIKLYLFYNMLEVGDRLFSALGQDTIDALFWTATEPKPNGRRKREHLGVLAHFLLTIVYVILHTLLVLLQATTLNVAINASNKALLTIMMSNNFVELKGSVFKKFDKNNLFQVSCSDVRERFHLFSLLFIVVVQTMKEYGWKEESFWNLAPDCFMVMIVEFLVDWIKHAFITRFNEVPAEVYKNYTIFLAYDLAQTKQKHAFSDHSDIVSRRMGFIPLPLGVVMIRVVGTAISGHTQSHMAIIFLAYLCLLTFRVLASIVILGKACDLIDHHQEQKKATVSSGSPSISTPKKEKKTTAQSSSPDTDISTRARTPTTVASTPTATPKRNQDSFTTRLDNDSMTAGASASASTKASTIVASEDMALLGAKLQTIDGSVNSTLSSTNTLHSPSPCNTPSTLQPRVKRSISVDIPLTSSMISTCSEDNLDPIEEVEDPDQQIVLHLQQPPIIDCVSSTPPTGEASTNISRNTTPEGSNSATNSTENSSSHRWSNNRRSQLLKQHQGELNRVVFSDSRRRPLSCTPPASTSISTSVSIDEDETKPEKTTETQEAELDLGPSAPTEPTQPIIDTGDSEDFNLYTSDPIVINKEFESSEDCVQIIDTHLETNDADGADDLLGIRPKALSSPDFMKTYKREMEQSDTTPPDIDEVETEPEKTSKAQEPELDLDLVPSESAQAIIDTGKNLNLHTDPPIVINKEFENSEDCIHITDPHTETNDINEGADDLLGFRPKALSSPESMKSYKPPHDPERDWPEIDNNEEVDGSDQVIEVEQQQQAITTDDQVDGAVCSDGTQPASSETEIGKAEIARRFAGSSLQQRRGSSEESLIRRRRRFDTEPTIDQQ